MRSPLWCAGRRAVAALAALLVAGAAAAQEARGPYADLVLAGRMIEQGKLGEAEALLVALAEDLPSSANLWFQLALARQLQHKDDEALASVRTALELDPKMLRAHLIAAELLAKRDTGAAKSHALTAVELAGTAPDAVRKAARICLLVRDLEACKVLIERVVAAAPNDREAHWLAAELALQSDDPERAAAAYEKVVELDPKDPFAWESLARVRVVLKRDKQAVEALRRTLAIHPSNVDAREKLIELMTKTRASRKEIDAQRTYLSYYRHWAKRAEGKSAPRRPGEPPR